MNKKGVQVLLVISMFIVFSVLLSVFVSAETLTYRGNTVTWDNFKFPTEAYAANGPGFKTSWSFCATNTNHAHCKINGSYDLGAVFVTQDANFVAWKIVAPNLTGARFCNSSDTVANLNLYNATISIEFDSDSNLNTGCNSYSGGGCPGFPGSEYRIKLNSTGNGNVSQINNTNNGFVQNETIVLMVNRSIAGANCSIPTTILMAVNKSYIKNLTGLSFQVEVKDEASGSTIRDILGGFSGGAFEDKVFMNKTTFDPKFFTQGCMGFSNATACINNSVGTKCKWDSDFNKCWPDMFGETSGSSAYSCSDMCGACNNQTDCTAQTECQWNANIFNPKRGTKGACIEDGNKVDLFSSMGDKNCDEDCDACMTNYTCTNSKVTDSLGLGGAGCKWVRDQIIGDTWCDNSAYDETELTCSAFNMDRCFTQADCTGVGGTWDSTDLYCKPAGEICYNGKDDDADNLIDCQDTSCYAIADNCGGGEDTLTSGRGDKAMDPMDMMKEDMMGNMVSAPTEIGTESSETSQFANNNSVIDIQDFAIADMFEAFGFGIGARNFSPSSYCNTTNGGKHGGVYYYLIDVDNNQTTGCTANISGTNYEGFDYKFVYKINGTNSTGQNYLETIKSYRCLNSSTTNFGLFPYIVFSPPSQSSEQAGYLQCTQANAVILAIPKSELANPKTTMRISVATGEAYSTGQHVDLSLANDTLLNMYYKPGTIDFKPKDCFSNPTSCGSKFSIIGGGKFMPFQDCMNNADTDGNGYAGCADPFCTNFPKCLTSSSRYNLSNDHTAPTVISNAVETFRDFAFIHWITDEPSNGTVKFYNTDSNCRTLNVSKVDDSPFAYDKYRTFHGMPFNSGIWGFSLLSSTTYYYKLDGCDEATNCAVSSCLNFSTSAVGVTNKVPLKFTLDNTTTNPLLNLTGVKIDNGTHNITLSSDTLTNLSSYTPNATLRFDSPANWSIALEGVDLAKTLSANLSGGFNITNTSDKTYVGLSSSKWQELAQSLGADTILLTIPIGSDSLLKCDEDNLSNCRNITNLANLTDGGMGYRNTTWRVPASLGFSTYYGSGSSGSSSSSSSSGGGGGGKKTTTVTTVEEEETTVAEESTEESEEASTEESTSASEEPVVVVEEETTESEQQATTETASVTEETTTEEEVGLAGKAFSALFKTQKGKSAAGLFVVVILISVLVYFAGKKKRE
ncbi:hypothetical protein J4434_02095 [Candidatus Woesearchaeota archaeon]|nr:hypothetical protein [Candidatus Woesearchaeota archaeon]